MREKPTIIHTMLTDDRSHFIVLLSDRTEYKIPVVELQREQCSVQAAVDKRLSADHENVI